jgi:hypothetical protein
MANIVVGYPMVNAGDLYINGLHLTTGTTDLLVNVAAGAARDSTNQDDIVLGTAAIANIATNGVNGLDTGTVAANTFYYVYVIGSSLSSAQEISNIQAVSTMAGGTTILNGTVIVEGTITQPGSSVNNNPQPAALISLSSSAPNLPEGYDMFRRLGAILTGGGSTILPFWQEQTGNSSSRRMWYDAPISVLAATAAAAFTAQSLAAAVPAIAAGTTSTEVTFQVTLDPNAAADFVEFRPTGSSSTNGISKMSGDVAAISHYDQITTPAAISAGNVSVDWKTDAASTVALTVAAYIDKL